MNAPVPPDEAERLKALQSYCVLDTPDEEAFDRIAALAAAMFDVPIALVSLIDTDRQWLKARIGLDVKETPRRLAFCAHAILSEDVMVVPNATLDPRFSDHPFVSGDPKIRFYAGAPLIVRDGYRIGTLCLVDCKPRDMTDGEVANLVRLSRVVVSELELRTELQARIVAEQQALEREQQLLLVENKLEESLERFQDYVNAGSDWFWEIGPDFRFTYLSEQFEAVTRFRIRDILGKTRAEFAQAGDTPEWKRHSDDLAHHRPFRDFVYEARRSDGEARLFSVSGTPVFNSDGAFQGYRGVGKDITVHVRVQEQLAHMETRFRDLIEGSIQGVYIHRDFKALFANDACARILGYDRAEDILALPSLLQMVSPSRRSVEFEQYQSLISGDMPSLQACVPALRRDGSTIWLDIVARAVLWDEKPAVQVTMTDVTRRITYEQQLEAGRAQMARQAAELQVLANDLERARSEAETNRARAEAASEAKSRFLAMMSHELRTPMTGVMGMVDLLLTSDLKPEQQQFVRVLRRSAESLLGLLNDILDFSKIEAGQLHLESIPFEVRETADEVVRLFSVSASEKGVLLSLNTSATALRGRGDPTRLRQVLFNLVSNAIKFTEQGRVEVRLSKEPHAHGKTALRFEVEDTGIGMSEDEQDRLFQSFSQANVTTARKFGGTGLGLAICKRLVEAMGGEIGVRSIPGKGTTFWFTLTLETPGEEKPDTPLMAAGTSQLAEKTKACRILLAEDNDVNRMLITTMLSRMGHHVEGVADGQAAVDAATSAQQPYDLILMDMQMPVMDGLEATRVLRASGGTVASIPIIALTADAVVERRATYMEAGLTDFLTKPVNWDQLSAVIGRIVK